MSAFHAVALTLEHVAKEKGVRVEVLHDEHDGVTLKVWIPFSVRRDTPDLGLLFARDPEKALDRVHDTFHEAHRALLARMRDYIAEHEDRSGHDTGDEDRR